MALKKLQTTTGALAYNLGNGEGFSVKEVIETAREVTSHPIPQELGSRRPGDPAVLVASQLKAQEELGWERKYSSLKQIIADAWHWHKNHPNGY